MIENKTTPITYEKKIQQLEAYKKEQEKLKDRLKLQIVDALLVDDMVTVKSITDQLNAILSMNYDEKISALKADRARIHLIPEKDSDYQKSIMSDNHIDTIEDSEITELISRRKIKWWEMLEEKRYKMLEEHFDNSNVGRDEKIDLPSSPTAPETPAEPETVAEPETTEWIIKTNEKLPLKNKNELKRIVLEQFKTKEELNSGSYETFAREYNANENNKYTITKSITWLISSLGLKINSTWVKELRDYLYGGNSISEQAEKKDLRIKRIKKILLEKFPTKEDLSTQKYRTFAKKYNEDPKNTQKMTVELFRLAKSLGFQGIEALKDHLYPEHLTRELIEKITPEKIDQPSAPEVLTTPVTSSATAMSDQPELVLKNNEKIPLRNENEIKKILLEKFPNRENLSNKKYLAFANQYNEGKDKTEKITRHLNRLARSLGFQGVEELKGYLYESEHSRKLNEKKEVRKTESNDKWNRKTTLETLKKLEAKNVFNPKKHFWSWFKNFVRSIKSDQDLIGSWNDQELLKNISTLPETPICLTKYLWWKIESIDTEYQEILWERYSIVMKGKNDEKIHDVNLQIRAKERELLKEKPELLKKYDAEIEENRKKALWKTNGSSVIHINKYWNVISHEDFNALQNDRPHTPIIGE